MLTVSSSWSQRGQWSGYGSPLFLQTVSCPPSMADVQPNEGFAFPRCPGFPNPFPRLKRSWTNEKSTIGRPGRKDAWWFKPPHMVIYIIIKSNVSISHSSRYSARAHQPRAPLISATQVTSWMASIRPGAAGLLIHIECSRVRDSSWMYLTSFITTRVGVELVAVQRKLPDRALSRLGSKHQQPRLWFSSKEWR